MSTCGGNVSTARLQLGKVAVQLVSQLESRTRVTVYADAGNDSTVYLTPSQSTPWQQGFPLAPGAAYQLDDRGARAALYGVGPGGGDKTVFIFTEGA